jgi:hypothetical protein
MFWCFLAGLLSSLSLPGFFYTMVKYISLKFCHKLSCEEIQDQFGTSFQRDQCIMTYVMATCRSNS